MLAHPLRSRLLSRLRTAGPATATDLAAALTTNTGATSYHLRKLESVGLVTDTGEGEGKRRLWRASTDFHSWTNSAFRDDEDAATALDWLQRDYVRQLAEKAERWLDATPNWPAEWVDVLGLNDTFVTVTPEQMRELHTRLDALLGRVPHHRRGRPRAPAGASVNIYRPPDGPEAPIMTDSTRPDDDRAAGSPPAAAQRTLLVLTATRWFPVGLVIGLATLLMLERGLSLSRGRRRHRHPGDRRAGPGAADGRAGRRARAAVRC